MTTLSRRRLLAAGSLTAGSLAAAGSTIALPGRASAGGRGRTALSVRGGDVSFALQHEAIGTRYSYGGHTLPLEWILRRAGATYVRLRVWTDPPAGYSTADSALRFALRASRAGLRILLDPHYSDFWADPGKQPTPVAWQGQDLPTLASTVYSYTRDLVRRFARAGAPIDMIQIGNEVVNGMLWPLGQIYRETGADWVGFTTLLKAGIAGARAGSRRPPRVMVHIDRGGNRDDTQWFYDHVLAEGVSFDVIGLSYYPFWHGTLSDLRANLEDTAVRYGKDIVLVETAYPWTLSNGDGLGNFVTSESQLVPGYPATPAGQAAFFETLRSILLSVPDGRGLGFVDWEPEWLPGWGGRRERAIRTTT
jgi:arabinogalactan endo-1,4-beta-galactosidase